MKPQFPCFENNFLFKNYPATPIGPLTPLGRALIGYTVMAWQVTLFSRGFWLKEFSREVCYEPEGLVLVIYSQNTMPLELKNLLGHIRWTWLKDAILLFSRCYILLRLCLIIRERQTYIFKRTASAKKNFQRTHAQCYSFLLLWTFAFQVSSQVF